MFDKLTSVESRYDELMTQLGTVEVQSDPSEYKKAAKALAELEPLVQKFREFKGVELDIAGAEELFRSADTDMRELADEELKSLGARREALLQELKILLVPKDPERREERHPRDSRRHRRRRSRALRRRSVPDVHAIRRASGLEARCDVEQRNGRRRPEGSRSCRSKARASTAGLKYESGVHRVQRVPATEASGRIHTSTATVAVLPEAEEVDIQINEKDLRIDTFCSSGPGGQSVNTTYSAVRITHLPTNLVVSQQDEKSQIKNRAKAMKVLRARLYEIEMQKQQDAIAKERRGQVGTGERSEKIRTYNFPQSRITDHRINFTTHHLHDVLEGDLRELIDEVTSFYNAQKLKEVTTVGPEDAGSRHTDRSECPHQMTPDPMTFLHERLAEAREQLVAAGIAPAEAAIDVDLFARTILGWDRARVLTARTEPAPAALEPRFSEWIRRRADREPSAYIVGNARVLGARLPRHIGRAHSAPESEFIVEESLAALATMPSWPLRGSPTSAPGAAAWRSACLTRSQRPTSPRPTCLQRRSPLRATTRVGTVCSDRVTCVETSFLDGIDGPFDLIAANPPYVKEGDKPALARDVRHEPDVALFGGATGLQGVEAVLDAAARTPDRGGWLVMEFGFGQEDDVRRLVAARPSLRIDRVRADLQGIPRTAVIQRVGNARIASSSS